MKARLDDLAVFGGDAEFTLPVHVGAPNIGDRGRFRELLDEALDRRWLSNDGPLLEEFEARVAAFLGVKHCVTTCNGTVALTLAAKAAGLTGEVIVPSFTFVATAHALVWQGLTPIFCDIDEATYGIDPAQVEALITPKTSGLVGVHVWGRPCAIDALSEIARVHRLRLLFDAAHAFGCRYRGRMLGSFGDAEVLSFHATKVLNTFEGGAVVTNDDSLAEQVRHLRNFGFTDYDAVEALGINGKMNEASAAMGLASLDSLPEFVEANRANYDLYRHELEDLPGLGIVRYADGEGANYHYVVIEIDEALSSIGRDVLHRVLTAENVLARRYFYPGCHQFAYYRDQFAATGRTLPNTARLSARVLALPTGTAVGPDVVRRICRIIQLVLRNGAEVGSRLKQAPSPS
jgi:dTDP-4-amino-4,6-dideoxygalactose transaminase